MMPIMDFFSACLENPLVTYALFAGLIASIMSGCVGTFVVVQRVTYVSGSISHAILGGMGLFAWLDRTYGWTSLSPLAGAMVSGLLSAILITVAKRQFQEREDSVIATLWTAGMASGIIFMSKTPGYSSELTNLLIGNILWVTKSDLILLGTLALFSLLFIVLHFQKLKLLAFDQQQAELQGIPTYALSMALMMLVAMTVVTLIQVVGIILVTSMLTLPQMIAGLFSKRISTMMLVACALSSALTFFGLMASFFLDWPCGASIALLSTIVYVALRVGHHRCRER